MATLYRHHRPQTFSDLVGQDHIRRTLQAALATGRLGHAYLFAGPRGTGKTTVARLLAKAINCQKSEDRRQKTEAEPCNQCQMCADITDGRSLDVIEVDAASNRGIDEIRDLRDKVKFAPTSARAKVYIIDEVHMLTKEAFNALLKTLEEPPAHATFVLATTELHKVPVTILSRCQVFLFKKASSADLVGRLQTVAEREQLPIEPAALAFLAQLAGGSYRDALSLLDQVQSVSGGPITRAAIHELLGIPSAERVGAILLAIRTAPAEAALARLAEADSQGVDLDHLVSQLIEAARALLHAHHGVTLDVPAAEAAHWDELRSAWSPSDLVALITELAAAKAQMKYASIPLLPLELVVLKFAGQISVVDRRQPPPGRGPAEAGETGDRRGDEESQKSTTAEAGSRDGGKVKVQNDKSKSKNTDVPAETQPLPPQRDPASAVASPQPPDVSEPIAEEKSEPQDFPPQRDPAIPAVARFKIQDSNFWPALLDKVRAANMSLYGLLKQAEFVGIVDGALKLQVPFAFARDRLMDRKHRERLLGIADELAGAQLTLNCEICPREHVVHHPEEEHDPATLAAVIDVFEIEEAPSST